MRFINIIVTVLAAATLLTTGACESRSVEPPVHPSSSHTTPPTAQPAGDPPGAPALPERLPHSMKGYVVYGFVRDGRPYFTLITGTNRLKSFDELDRADALLEGDGPVCIRVAGVERAKELVRRIPADSGAFVATVRHVSVAQNTVPEDVGVPGEALLAQVRAALPRPR